MHSSTHNNAKQIRMAKTIERLSRGLKMYDKE